MNSKAAQVTQLSAFFRHGQAFLTWTNVTDTNTYYKVYRSTSPIVQGTQLSSCEYLGWTNNRSALDFNLSRHDQVNQYLRIDSAGAPLSSSKGLFVATTLVNGNYYYAVTTFLNNVETTTITSGANALSQPLPESVMVPQPVFQQFRTESNATLEVYCLFTSLKYNPLQPPVNAAGFYAGDFLLFRNGSGGNQPLFVQFHGGAKDLFQNITVLNGNAMNLNVEDYLPNNVEGSYWGANSNYSIFKTSTSNPVSGINYNFLQTRYNAIIDWAVRHLAIDSNRIYTTGSSGGACGAYIYSVTYPERIAACDVSVPSFNFSFINDWLPNCSLNTGKKGRLKGDALLGTVATNLPTNLGISTYDVLNGGYMISHFKEKDYPFIYSINGKQDQLVGWTEKTVYYPLVNSSHIGGYYFWDNRTHDGTGSTWGGNNFDIFRFRLNCSYPAFANCSLNEDFGNGNGNTGEAYGTLNGAVDWLDDPVDDSLKWEVNIFIRDLKKENNEKKIYADSATVDVTPRRLQSFHVYMGDTITWQVINHQQVIQSGTQVHNGGIIVISGVKIFKDTATFRITKASWTYYADHDGDNYGDPDNSMKSPLLSPPAGWVSDTTDCNDANAAVHPGATEGCNSIDDNCNGQIDEGVKSTFYADADGDTYGNLNSTTQACSAPAGYANDNSDCNDGDPSIYPGNDEQCNEVDDDCNEMIDDDVVYKNYYEDADHDGYGISLLGIFCLAPANGAPAAGDCDDANGMVYPGATEACNDLDDNCNLQIDEGAKGTFYIDADGDGYGIGSDATQACSAPAGYVNNNSDCNDDPGQSGAAVHPNATEVCNNIDDNCNNQIDEGLKGIFYADADGDGYGKLNSTTLACTVPPGYANNSTDCNDASASIHPNATEVCNGIDENCNNQIDEAAVSASIVPAGSMFICSKASIPLQANTGTGLLYQWKKDNSNISGATASSYLATAAGSYTVRVTSGTCSATSLATTVTTMSLPTATISPSGTVKICEGISTTLTANPGGNLGYQWLLNADAIPGATTPVYSTSVTGPYTLRVTNSNGCSKTSATTTIKTNSVSVKITHTGSLNICSTSSVTLNAKTGSGYTYKWYRDNVAIAGATAISYVATQAGTYKYLATISQGCTKYSSTLSVTNCRLDGTDLDASSSALIIYPNPFSRSTTISFSLSQSENACLPDRQVSLKIYDITGRLVRILVQEEMSAGDHKLTWDACDQNGNIMSAGIYLLRMEATNQNKTIRLTVVQ